MTDSGVLMAWARLPTWVRARSTISRLASISALVSRASGAISTGKLALQPLGAAGADVGDRFRDALERREAEAHLEDRGQQQHDAERGKGAAEVIVEAAGLIENLAGVAGDADQEFAVGAEIDRPLHHAQASGPRDRRHSRAGCRRRSARRPAPPASAASCPTASARPASRPSRCRCGRSASTSRTAAVRTAARRATGTGGRAARPGVATSAIRVRR